MTLMECFLSTLKQETIPFRKDGSAEGPFGFKASSALENQQNLFLQAAGKDMEDFLAGYQLLAELGSEKEPVDDILAGMIEEKTKEMLFRIGMVDELPQSRKSPQLLSEELEYLENLTERFGEDNAALQGLIGEKRDELRECGL